MNWKFVLFWLLLLTERSFAQADFRVYTWNEVKNCSPDTIYALSLRKMKLDSLPAALARFKKLEYLDISYNKLKSLPLFLADLGHLKEIDFSKNKFSDFPEILL